MVLHTWIGILLAGHMIAYGYRLQPTVSVQVAEEEVTIEVNLSCA